MGRATMAMKMWQTTQHCHLDTSAPNQSRPIPGRADIAVLVDQPWEYPLSLREKLERVMMCYQAEVELMERQRMDLESRVDSEMKALQDKISHLEKLLESKEGRVNMEDSCHPASTAIEASTPICTQGSSQTLAPAAYAPIDAIKGMSEENPVGDSAGSNLVLQRDTVSSTDAQMEQSNAIASSVAEASVANKVDDAFTVDASPFCHVDLQQIRRVATPLRKQRPRDAEQKVSRCMPSRNPRTSMAGRRWQFWSGILACTSAATRLCGSGR